jgi:phospholipid/cholesterol/gamma-HCH transport system ATP-binding protein
MAHGSLVVMRDLSFEVHRGEIFVIMGGSGSGKSTLLRHLIGLQEPLSGHVEVGARSLTSGSPEARAELWRACGIVYQGAALFSAMTLAENIALPLGEHTDLSPNEIRELASLKLALAGLRGFEDRYPSEISDGSKKRAALARALALDPDLLFLDEPSAGLDPVTARRLDQLILELRHSLGATVVVATHDLASIFTIADTAVYLDTQARTMTALGAPHLLVRQPPNPQVREFLTGGGVAFAEGPPHA